MEFERAIAEIKQKLMTADDFGEVSNAFFTFAEQNPQFMDLGEVVEDHPIVVQVIGQTLQRLTGRPPTALVNFSMRYIESIRFYHGAYLADGMPGSVIYYEDQDMIGMLTIVKPNQHTEFVRFRGQPLPGSMGGVGRPSRT